MRRLLLRLAYANVVISLHAAGLACAALVLAGERLSLPAIALPAAAMYAVYTFDKVARFDPQDDVNDPERSAFIRRFRGPLLVTGAVAAIGGGAAALAHGLVAALLFVLPLIAGVLYALPLLPRGAPVRRIRTSPASSRSTSPRSGWRPPAPCRGSSSARRSRPAPRS